VNRQAPGHVRLVVFVLVVSAITALLVAYTLTHRRPPIPSDADHAPGLNPAECLRCHGPAGRNPRSKNHPLNDQCFGCHERA
jgi:Doubled CXXCH motif (Paired_CXXCH_1)